MDRLVATGGPAGAFLHPEGVIGASDQQPAPADLLEVAFHAQVGVADGQEFGIHRTVSRMANGATLARRFVLKHVRSALRGMAAKASFVLRQQGGAAGEIGGT